MPAPKLVSPLYVEPNANGYCTVISNINQMGLFHSHDYYEAFLVTEGQAVHFVNGKEFKLVKGSLVFVRPNDEHCYLMPISPDFQFINAIIVESVVSQLVEYLGSGFPADILLDSDYPAQRDLNALSFEPLSARLHRLIIYPKTSLEQYNTAFRLVVADIISQYIDAHIFSEISSYPAWFKKLISEMYLPENYSRPIDSISILANCTPEHLCRTFRKYLNMTPSQFINNIRIENAALSVVYTDKPIIEISEEVGFDSLSYFYRLFNEKYHMSPSSYRRYSREEHTSDD